MNKLAAIIGALVIAAAAFWAGTFYQSRQSWSGPFGMTGGDQGRRWSQMGAGQRSFGGPGGQGGPQGFPGMPGGQGGPGGGRPGERLVSGRLDKAGNDQLTITTRFGSVKVKFDAGTPVKQAAKAGSADLKAGKQIIVEIVMDKDGAMSAKSILME